MGQDFYWVPSKTYKIVAWCPCFCLYDFSCCMCIIIINETEQAFSMSNVVGGEELWILESFMNEGMTKPTKKDCQPEGVCEWKIQSLIGRFCLRIKLYHRIYSASCQASVTYETGHNDFHSKYSDSLFILEGVLKSHSFILHWRNGWGLREGKAGRLDGKFVYLVPSMAHWVIYFCAALRFFSRMSSRLTP